MRILCPMCGFAREIDETKVPPRAQMATCPKCTHKFRFRVVDGLEPDAPWATGAAQNTAGGLPKPAGQSFGAEPNQGHPGNQPGGEPDPMAAQRASAAEAWKRLQGPQASSPDAPGAAPQQPGASPAAPSGPDSSGPGSFGQAPSGQEQPLDSGEPLPTQPANRPENQSGDQLNAQPNTPPWTSPGGARPSGSPVPFEDLPKHGFFPGLWGTIRLIITGPAAFFRTMPPHGGMAKPLAFHLLLAEFMIVCQYLWSMAGIGATAEYLGSPELMDLGLGAASAAPALLFLVYPLLLVLRLMLMTGIIHLLLRMVRSGDSGAEATFRVLCYSAAPLLLGILPGFGPLIGGVWSIGLTIIGLKEVHRTRFSAAMFAVLVPILMMLAAVLGLMQGMVKAG